MPNDALDNSDEIQNSICSNYPPAPRVPSALSAFDDADLCCCEYINTKGERSHLLGFCCDCETLDDSVERLIQRQDIPESHVREIYSVIQDRLRIPWCGGARRLDLLTVTPIAILPLLGSFSTLGPFSTVIAFLLIPILLRVINKYNGNRRTTFHISLSMSSLLYSFSVIYSTSENTWRWQTFNLTLFIAILVGMGITRKKGRRDASLELDNLPFYYYCRKCQFYISGRDHHCNWLNCCVGQGNRCWFMLTISFAIVWISSIIYSYYASLEKSGFSAEAIYANFSTAISFTTTLYGIIILLFLFGILMHQLNMSWKGMSYLDWKFKNLK